MAFGLRGRWAAGVAGEKPAGHERPSPRARRRSWGFAALLAALVLSLYLPAVRFGLIWDDPLWFQQGAGRSAWEIITALSTYQFYRPLAILLNRSLVSPAGLVNVTAAHLIQLAAHLSAALLAVPVLRALGLGARHARLAALVFALFPLSYQAVAWQSPQQPLTQAGVLAALACAARAHAARPALWLTLSAVCYGAALLFQESALPFAFAFVWLAVVQRGRRGGRHGGGRGCTWPWPACMGCCGWACRAWAA